MGFSSNKGDPGETLFVAEDVTKLQFEEKFRKLVKEIESEIKPLDAGVSADNTSLVAN